MKKIFTMATLLMAGFAAAFAQDDTDSPFQFVKADGTVVPNGSTVIANTLEDDGFGGGKQIKSGLYVKNTSEDAAVLSIGINVEQLDNGTIQLCFPVNCAQYGLGEKETSQGAKEGGEQSDLQTEWMPTAYGKAKVTYTIKNYEYIGMGNEKPIPKPHYDYIGDGASVTVIYQYDDPAAISAVTASAAQTATYYDMTGRRVAAPAKGLYVKKTTLADGSVKSQKVVLQ